MAGVLASYSWIEAQQMRSLNVPSSWQLALHSVPTMVFRTIAAAMLACTLIAFSGEQELQAQVQQPASRPSVRQLLQKIGELTPDPCGPPFGKEDNWHSANVESRLFEDAADLITRGLNASSASLPADRAAEALKELEAMSVKINASWPPESRFHFQILDLPPALVVKMSIRTHQTFFVFGEPEEVAGKPNRSWSEVGFDEEFVQRDVPQSRLDLYPLYSGHSGKTRFLARFVPSGCAGSLGVVYDAREWNPKGTGDFAQIIKQDGAFGLDGKVAGFERVGKLRTEGPLITLPYCWFSAIDTWDNPSLCAADTYDLSGREVKFRSREYNRPDLVPIAKAIEYAQKRDIHAVLGYCDSADVARRMVRDIPPLVVGGDLRITPLGAGKKRVEFDDPPAYRFDVEKHGDRWVVVAFSAE